MIKAWIVNLLMIYLIIRTIMNSMIKCNYIILIIMMIIRNKINNNQIRIRIIKFLKEKFLKKMMSFKKKGIWQMSIFQEVNNNNNKITKKINLKYTIKTQPHLLIITSQKL